MHLPSHDPELALYIQLYLQVFRLLLWLPVLTIANVKWVSLPMVLSAVPKP